VPLGGGAFKEQRDEARVQDARKRVHELVEGFTLNCRKAGVTCRVLESAGRPSDQIALESQRYDLILLGQQTYFDFETRSDPDDTLHQLLRRSPRPIVTAPRGLPAGESVLIAYDGSLQAARTLQTFVSLELHGAQAVHVISVHRYRPEAAWSAERAVEYLGMHKIAAHSHPIVSAESPAEVLLERAQALDGGLMVMGAFGKSMFHELVFGSVTRTILDQATLPLFLFH
jgi:nucleotide-binding universal stress UspA family protein